MLPYKFVTSSLCLLCMLRTASPTLILPKKIIRLVYEYVLEDNTMVHLPVDAQIAVYNEGLVYWHNNETRHIRFPGRIEYTIPQLSNFFGIKHEDLTSIAVSSDGKTTAISLRPGTTTYVARKRGLSICDDCSNFTTLISSDGQKVLTYMNGRPWQRFCGRMKHWFRLLLYGLLFTNFAFLVMMILGTPPREIIESMLPLQRNIIWAFLTGHLFVLFADLSANFPFNQRFRVTNLDECPRSEDLMSTDDIPGTELHDLSNNFTRISTNKRTIGAESTELPHPTIRSIRRSREEQSLCSIRIHRPGLDNDEAIMQSMDRQVVAIVRRIGDVQEVVLLRRFEEFKKAFYLH